LHTGGNTPPAPQIVIFQTFPASQGAQNCSPSRLGSSHSPSPITEFAPEPITLASDSRTTDLPFPREISTAR